MKVVEVFRSIQGEGTQAGRPCTFVRLGGCNLHCTWCDTPYARGESGRDQTVGEAVAEALALGSGLCCVTGGEPLMQPEAPALIRALLQAGREVQVMTNGSLPLHGVPAEAILAVDIKTPWSHGTGTPATEGGRAPGRADLPDPPHFDRGNFARLTRRDEAKFVVRDRREFEWAALWAEKAGLFDRVGTVFVGPAWGEIDPAVLAEWILESRLPLRLNLQWHKVLWGRDTRR